jgi:hypothetical protein
MKFKDNLNCVQCELNNWDYDKDGLMFPIAYELAFKFYGTDVTAYVTTRELQKESAYVEFSRVETDGDLLSSFEELFEDNEFKSKVENICKDCWEDNLNSGDYDYKGVKL